MAGGAVSEGHDPIIEAVEALRVRGHTVEPWSHNFPYWLVDGETLTEGELLALAVQLGLLDSSGLLQ
jgi:hypothetical protein